MERDKILLCDDDPYILEATAIDLAPKYEVRKSQSIEKAKRTLKSEEIDLIVVDLNFEGSELNGIDLIDHLQSNHPNIPAVVLSGSTETKTVVEAMRRPLVDFITKDGTHNKELSQAIKRGINKRALLKAGDAKEVFQTKSPIVKDMFKKMDRVLLSGLDSSILILGESGTGKEYLANYVAKKLRKNLVAVNMSSIPKEMAESELFGHVKGAFTGAVSNKIGYMEQAHQGILFLDEIGDCSLDIQSKLLRAIQEKEIRAVGDS
ncbi:MAG: sigma 54-interacting transcriptional regulator, partial [Bdellovibrionales bacterium]|nr:sigma 54-interacting transcriptional regulator [Bdellovibrionales bacterium]